MYNSYIFNREYVDGCINDEKEYQDRNKQRLTEETTNLVKYAEQYTESTYKVNLWKKVGYEMDRGYEPIEALAIVFNEALTSLFWYGVSGDSPQDKAIKAWLRQWFANYTLKTEDGKSVNLYTLERAYAEWQQKQEKVRAKEEAKKQREHEKTHGYEVNSQGKKVTWQGVRSALKRGGWTVNKHDDVGAQTMIVTGAAWDDPSVTIRHAIKKAVPYTTEELLAKGYWVDPDTHEWLRETYWDKKGIALHTYEMTYTVDDEDKIAEQEEHVRQVKKTLEGAGYVVHEREEYQSTHKSTRLAVTGWKKGV